MLNNFQHIPQPTIAPPAPVDDSEASGHPRRSSYAAMRDLSQRFSDVGICTDQIWEWIKAEHGVDSRSQFTGLQWAKIAASLQSARRDAAMFKMFVDGIPCEYFRIHVFASDPNVCIGRPRDIKKHHVESEWFDFQAFSTEHQTSLTVTQGKRTRYYEPATIAPKPATKPAPEIPKSKTVALLNTNARGQVLNVFGDVIEVHHA